MPPSIGLTLYNLGQRRGAGTAATRPPRPPDRLIWLHAPTRDAAGGLWMLAHRLIEDDGCIILMTCPETLPPRDGVIHVPPPPDTPDDARQFLDHWRPEAGVFSGGEIRPALVHEAADRQVPLLMVDARQPSLPPERDGWYPGLMRSALARFQSIAAIDEAAARSFRKAGAMLSAVAVTGRMEEESAALPCLEAERSALARLFVARPVWFAAGLTAIEESAIILAHRLALQHAHRLLLIVLPDDPARVEPLAARIEGAEDRPVALRSRDEEPDAETEVFVVDSPAEYGLWYRLAPVTFLGGSLLGTGPTRNPLEAASLGSAILHGPRAGAYAPVLSRLSAAKASRLVSAPHLLAQALNEVLAPDRSARLAQAAWAVASDGAEVTERTLGQLRQLTGG